MSSDLVFILVSFFIFSWLGILSFLLFHFLRTVARLTVGISDTDIKTLLEGIMADSQFQKKSITSLDQKLADSIKDGKSHFCKTNLVRYNPFNDTGGNQSFVMVLLNSTNDGFVITSLHGRESTRVFAKPIKSGQENGFEFSKEEKDVISSTVKSS